MDIEEFEERFVQAVDDDSKASLVMEFINKNGINKIRSKDLDRIINLYGRQVFWLNAPKITELYDIVSSRESNSKITWLTWGMFIFALITTIVTIYEIIS